MTCRLAITTLQPTKMRLALAAGIGASIVRVATAALEACPSASSAEYDYIVVGAGAGGGMFVI